LPAAQPALVRTSQLVRQAPSWQVKAPQLIGGSGLSWQAPVPLHTRACTEVPPEAQTAPQLCPWGLGLHTPLPLQRPVVPQGFAVVSSAQLSGSAPSSGTLLHIPWGLAQLWHIPQLALPQQVPSTQLPEPHSLPPLQVAPSAFLPQAPSAQTPTEQCSSLWQVCRQLAAPSQVKGAQAWRALGGQLPSPSQKAAADCSLPPAGQAAPRHMVAVPHLRQAPAPLQVPSLPQLLSGDGAQVACGSLPPAGTLVQVPIEPGTAQLLQAWPQAVAQHTPSMQKPEVHSGPSPQALPSDLVPQRPLPSQRLGGWHCPLSVQELKQSVPSALQVKGAQAWLAPAWQLPAPSQADTRVRTPPAQLAARHWVPAA
jgi:hypothetical protein